jgi:hypothetical protein
MVGNKFFEDLSQDEVTRVLVQVNDEDLSQDEVTRVLVQVNGKLRPILFYGEHYWTADYRRIRVVERKMRV